MNVVFSGLYLTFQYICVELMKTTVEMYKNKVKYERPEIEVLCVCAEAGIATSYGQEGAAGGTIGVDDTDWGW